MIKDLYFNYPSTSKIRVHHKNVMTNDKGLFWVKTKKLDFKIAEKLCIRSGVHIYIPLSVYRNILNEFYNKVLNEEK